ncbi:AAA family ATPase [Tundrisphaera lichenicola]|uniref:AAA family ATPase n=1 Tax=Tundrisphaera lichenicola TaxID=2029860 RepID=UPI003EBA0231
MYYQEFLSEVLREPFTAIAYQASRHLAATYPDRAMIEGSDCDFNRLFNFAKAGGCRLRNEASTHNQVAVSWWEETGIVESPRNVWFEVDWEGHSLEVVVIDWDYGCNVPYHFILADSAEVARGFYAAVCGYRPELQDELLVFDGGSWTESGRLFRQIEGSTLENLILPEKLKADILGDVRRFFDARMAYEKHGVAWKRGLLFVGPPGNGKTHAIKALINETGRPCLYVKTFDSEKYTDETGIRRVFARARQASPCILVFEDLDALINNDNRSFFLNELDGFAANLGILTIATTNHPEKLDPAILDRPSRFDRKYHFGLPAIDERRAYIGRWNRSMDPEARLTPEGESKAAELSEGFSFAYLKELLLSTLMDWIAREGGRTMDEVLAEQAGSLREQMRTMDGSAPEGSPVGV